jgi:group I intron endonuclease
LLKYGHSTFSFEILEYCESENVIKREQHYIDLLKPEYNICKIAGSMLGFRHTEESKAKTAASQLGKKLSEEHKANISEGMKGRVLSRSVKIVCSDETRAKMSKTRQNFSDEKRLNLAEKLALAARRINNSGTSSSIVEVTNKETGEIVSYISVRAAARALGISHSTILKYIKLGKVFKQIYYFSTRSSL